jgi:glutathione S-transferase
MLVLRGAPASSFVRKVRIVTSLLGLEDRIEFAAADTNDPNDSLRQQNPLGKIPALILESGEAIFDSAVIVEYLDWLAGGGKVIPSEPEARFRSLTQ